MGTSKLGIKILSRSLSIVSDPLVTAIPRINTLESSWNPPKRAMKRERPTSAAI